MCFTRRGKIVSSNIFRPAFVWVINLEINIKNRLDYLFNDTIINIKNLDPIKNKQIISLLKMNKS